MTPQQKANDLFQAMCKNQAWDDIGAEINNAERAKKCVIICIDEILNTIYNEDFEGHLIDEIDAASYWKLVKEETNKFTFKDIIY